MSLPQHLQCRNGWYHFRIRIPQDLIAIFSRHELRKSLKTQDISLARFLKKTYLANIEKLFTLIRTGLLNREQIQDIVRTNCLTQLALHEERRDAGDRAYAGSVRIPTLEQNLREAKTALAELDFKIHNDQLKTLITEHKLDVEEDSDEYRMLQREFLKRRCDMLRIELERSQGNYDNDYDMSLRPTLIQKELPMPTLPPHLSLAHSTNAPLLSEAIDLMLKEKGHSLGEKTLSEYGSYRDFVLDLVGDRPINTYTRTNMLDARENLKKFPKRARQEPELKELSVKKILSMNISGPKLAERTYQKYLSFLTTVFNYSVEEGGTLDKSPCPKWKKSKDLQDDEGWDAFDTDDLEKFFTSSYFIKPAIRVREPEKFWIPLIAYQAGMREDEICQLYKNDVCEVDGIWCFDINAKEDKKLKNKPSKRIIPIPPEILELGFLDYYRSVKHKRLWPNLKRGKNGYSHNYSKMIGKHIRRHVTKDKKKVFHSFRDTFAEENIASKVAPDVFGGILGHAPVSPITALYSGKHPVDVMFDAMNEVKHRIDIVALLQGEKPKSQPKGKVITLLRKNAKG